MSVNTSAFTFWQKRQPGPPFTSSSPNLVQLVAFLILRWGGANLGIYVPRPVRGGSAPSSHWFGAALDWRWFAGDPFYAAALAVWKKAKPGTYRARLAEAAMKRRLSSIDPSAARTIVETQVIPWLILNSEQLGIQAIHDYVGGRIWRSYRATGEPSGGWEPQRPDSTGMGQPWAMWLHLEVHEGAWADARPVPERLAVTVDTPKPVLRLGMANAEVLELNQVLRYIKATAAEPQRRFTAKTRNAVRRVQRQMGVEVTGVWDRPTAAAFPTWVVTL